uniref:Uncharacterized protein n=1 Tax=Panagrolaimus sp. ES5 TaxID=591445 RepID=A0AC34GT16_9BILA
MVCEIQHSKQDVVDGTSKSVFSTIQNKNTEANGKKIASSSNSQDSISQINDNKTTVKKQNAESQRRIFKHNKILQKYLQSLVEIRNSYEEDILKKRDPSENLQKFFNKFILFPKKERKRKYNETNIKAISTPKFTLNLERKLANNSYVLAIVPSETAANLTPIEGNTDQKSCSEDDELHNRPNCLPGDDWDIRGLERCMFDMSL